MYCILSVYWNIPHEALYIGTFPIRYYSLFFIFAFVSGIFVYYQLSKREPEQLKLIPIIISTVFVSTIIGARLAECLFYQFDYFAKHPLEIVFPFSKGQYTGFLGLSGHGAAITIPFGLYLLAHFKKLNYLELLDKVCICIALAAFFIRLGNLFNSEIQGILTNLPWGFVFLQRGETLPRHPVQLYESLTYLLIFFVLIRAYLNFRKIAGVTLSLFLILIYTSRFLLEYLKAPLTLVDTNRSLTTGQFLSVPFIFLGCLLLIYLLSNGKKGIEV